MMHTKSLFIFRRDLRLSDNTGLIAALKSSKQVLPCFIFDPRQIGNQPYFGNASVAFMVQSLADLHGQLGMHGAKLYFFEGKAEEVVAKLIKTDIIDAVFFNHDYSPFSKLRDTAIADVCKNNSVACNAFHDALLTPPGIVRKDDGGVYTVYTPYARKAMTFPVPIPVQNKAENYFKGKSVHEDMNKFNALLAQSESFTQYPAGRKNAINILSSISQYKNYDEDRNIPSKPGTTRLSAHHKFGTVSARETYHAVAKNFGPTHTLIRELYWRDFFTQIGHHFPHVLGKCFYAKYDKLMWDDNQAFFKAWCEGKTGFPIVDAGMRELNATGYMHNRVRMITASFLIKDLHIDWRLGERYFANKLADYDPLVNNGNWQWAASTGCDAAPYFRIFNPWLQQKKFDPDCVYIKQWIPELRGISAKELHEISTNGLKVENYPSPMVWHDHEKAKVLGMYSTIK